MSSLYGLFVTALIPAIALVITGLSGYFVYRQKTAAYGAGKTLLIFVHILFAGVLLLEFLRSFQGSQITQSSQAFFVVYSDGATSFVLWDVVLLTVIALAVYSRPGGERKGSIFIDIFRNKRHFVALGILIAYVTFANVYLIFSQPYTLGNITNVFGVDLISTVFSNNYLLVLFPVLIYFILYPSTLLFIAARKIGDKGVRRALILLPVNWSGIGAELLVFNGYLINVLNVDAISFGYLIAAIAFSVTAFLFRRASLLASLFEPIEAQTTIPATFPFSKKIGMENRSLLGKSILLEVDTSVTYESAVKDFATEFLSTGFAVFAFTSKGSPIYNLLAESKNARIYVMSAKVSYPKPVENSSEVLVPQYDQPILLDLFDKLVSSNRPTGTGLIYDNLSDMILFSGFETSYKFVKQANEIVNEPNVTSLLVMTHGAHDEKMVNQIKSLFPIHLAYDQRGLRVTRRGATGYL